jgi:hypothetical protein
VDEIWLHPGSKDAVFSSAVKSFATSGVLDHTSIVITEMDKQGNVATVELALSTPFLSWGLRLPPCPQCQIAMYMRYSKNSGPRPNNKAIMVQCKKCQHEAKILLPKNVKVLSGSDIDVKGLVCVHLSHPISCMLLDWKVHGVTSGEVD